MKPHQTNFQQRLCNVLQERLPVCRRPFAEVADILNSDESEVLRQTIRLKQLGVIRYIRAMINYRALGFYSTLVAACVPNESLQAVADAVSSLQNVSHNYQRNHYYNLWFTLQARTPSEIDATLSELSGRFGIEFHSLPVRRVFKLDVRFDAQSGGHELLQGMEKIPKEGPVRIDRLQKQILSKLQNNLPLTIEPFSFLCEQGLKEETVLEAISALIDKGVIRRIAAVVDHRRLGFTANVLFAGKVPPDRIIQAGQRLANLPVVSHCYERETCPDWPYNLFAMMHSRSMEQIQHTINEFTEAEKINSFQILPTAVELKKQPVRYTFD